MSSQLIKLLHVEKVSMPGSLQYIFPEQEILTVCLLIPFCIAQVEPHGQEIDQHCGSCVWSYCLFVLLHQDFLEM
jgi:hypothetical protein